MKNKTSLVFALLSLLIIASIAFLGCGTVTSSSGGSTPVTLSGKLYVTGNETFEVYVIDPNTLQIEKTITLQNPSAGGSWMALSPNGRYLYITDANMNMIHAISTETQSLHATMSIPSYTTNGGIAFTADGKRALMAHDDSVQLINSETHSPLSVFCGIPHGYSGLGAARSLVNDRIYVATNGSYLYSFSIEADAITLVSTVGSSSTYYDVVFPVGIPFFFASRNNTDYVQYFNVTTEGYITQAHWSQSRPLKITPSFDGAMLYIGSLNGMVCTLESRYPTNLRGSRFDDTLDVVLQVAVAPDNSVMFAYGIDNDTVPDTTRIVKLDMNRTVLASVEIEGRMTDGTEGGIIYVPQM